MTQGWSWSNQVENEKNKLKRWKDSHQRIWEPKQISKNNILGGYYLPWAGKVSFEIAFEFLVYLYSVECCKIAIFLKVTTKTKECLIELSPLGASSDIKLHVYPFFQLLSWKNASVHISRQHPTNSLSLHFVVLMCWDFRSHPLYIWTTDKYSFQQNITRLFLNLKSVLSRPQVGF